MYNQPSATNYLAAFSIVFACGAAAGAFVLKVYQASKQNKPS